MVSIETFYAAAANAGLLINASIDGQIVAVDFRAPDETVLDGLALSTEYTMQLSALHIAASCKQSPGSYRASDLPRA